MPETSIRVEGLQEMRRALRRMDKDIRKDVRGIDKEVALEVAEVVRAETPTLSGRLAKSVKGGADSSGGFVRAGGAKLLYGQPIHWGWPRRNIEANRFMVRGLQKLDKGMGGQYMDRVADTLKSYGIEVD